MVKGGKTELASRIRRRDCVSEELRNLELYLQDEANIVPGVLRIRLAAAKDIYEAFRKAHTNVVELKADEEENQIRRQFENRFFEAVNRAKGMLESETKSSSTEKSSAISKCSGINLPQVRIPEFAGDPEDWLPFHDTFLSLIHNNDSLQVIQKYHYLVGSVKGEARAKIANIEISDEYYELAWNTLKEEYHNKKALIKKHIDNIVLMPEVRGTFTLQNLVNETQQNLRVLEKLGQPVHQWDLLLLGVITKKLDSHTIFEWEKVNCAREVPSWKQFMEFLTIRCEFLKNVRSSNKKLSSNNSSAKSLVCAKCCPVCESAHEIFHCKQFLDLEISERTKLAKEKNLCLNCLRAGHNSRSCKSSVCKHCKSKHNSLLHKAPKIKDTGEDQEKSLVCGNSFAVKDSKKEIILSTAMVLVKGSAGELWPCRALLDSGSQANIATARFIKKLGLKPSRATGVIESLGQCKNQSRGHVDLEIRSTTSHFSSSLSFAVMEEITGRLPGTKLKKDRLGIPNDIKLADPNFHIPQRIDLLLGSELFWNIIEDDFVNLGKNLPRLQKTSLGWIVGGACPSMSAPRKVSVNCALHDQIQKFWEVETVPESVSMTSDEQLCIEMFHQTTRRHIDSKFEVRLPFKLTNPKLGNSLGMAIKRLRNLEIKLAKNSELKLQYTEFLKEYEDLGHMTEVPEPLQDEEYYYIPHHCVLKGDSQTTKLRVVFDASARAGNDMSLNEMLMVGPKMQDDLFDILIRFRQHQIAFTADIAKMYRQIWVNQDDRKYQRIVWRENPEQKIKHYQLNTVTYGMASSSFLATKCIHQLAIENAKEFPVAAQHVLKNFYVDDLLSGAGTPEEALKIIMEVSKMLDQAGFKLRKWASNCKAILSELSSQSQNEKHLLSEKEVSKTLGIFWDSRQDTLGFQIHCITDNAQKVTKRGILSMISKIFDPLGLIGPVTVKAKILIQALWKSKLDWDDRVDEGTFKEWKRFLMELEQLGKIQIGRKTVVSHPTHIELHGFCDASERAYGAAIFIKSMNDRNETSFKLLCAKSRVAPLKTISLPRLELCGASLLTKLMHSVSNILGFPIHRRVFWTDSQIALAWIRGEPGRWKTFVAHRVSHIQRFSNPGDWFHIRGSDNPADLLTRGVFPSTLVDNNLWWGGPEFISQGDNWASAEDQAHISLDEIPEARKIAMTVVTVATTETIIDRFSNFNRAVRVTAYVLRFINKIKRSNDSARGVLTTKELQDALYKILKIIQSQAFIKELKTLEKTGSVDKQSKLIALSPFVDSTGLIRVGGRLQNADLPYEKKHPILLPKHNFTELLIRHYHLKYLHLGAKAVLANIREKFWPTGGLNYIKGIIRKCVACFKVKPKLIDHPMGHLPKERVTPSRPFLNTGVDFAGPFEIRANRLRKAKHIKVYLAAFICLATKAVHLELVEDLSTAAFLNALKRFISRRGLCLNIYSDNATNFVGAKNEIAKFIQSLMGKENGDEFQASISNMNIKWHFIPPRSPHFGGLWEAAIKSAKGHLKRVLGNQILTYEELLTTVVQIEACLNSRPLTPLSNDPNDMAALTPGHFLIGGALLSLPEGETSTLQRCSAVTRYQLISKMVQEFWKRWSKEYLHALQIRVKQKREGKNGVAIGDLVLMKDDNLPPLKWQLGRIIKLYKGVDGVVRVVDVKTAHGTYKRASKNIAILPNQDSPVDPPVQ